MTLQPFEHYEQIGDNAAYARWNPRMKWIVAVCAVIGIGVGLAVGKQIEIPVIGAFAGGVLGYIVFRIIVFSSSSSTADELYRADWCAARGMQYLGDGYMPPDSPIANKGDERKSSDVYQGVWNGLQTLIYNYTYTDVTHDSDGRHETDYDFKIMRLAGVELPIKLLTIHKRGALDKFKWVDDLQGKLGPERPISLESAAFNEKFDLTIDDDADEIWIRRIFDPQTIQMLADGSFTIPDLRYYYGAWWVIERYHFKTRDLDEWVGKQKLAADAIALLSRVQTL